MAQIQPDQVIITKQIMDEDPNFASFSDVTSTAESDNTLASRRPVVSLGEFWPLASGQRTICDYE